MCHERRYRSILKMVSYPLGVKNVYNLAVSGTSRKLQLWILNRYLRVIDGRMRRKVSIGTGTGPLIGMQNWL
jgi:hypothetical protein